jgi:Meiotically up-regulated gene 113
MIDKAQAVQSLADDLERLGAPLRLPEDWIILCDHDDLQHMPRQLAKRLLTQAKKETARRWLWERFDPTELDLELSQEDEEDDGAEEFDERRLKQHAVNSIDEVVSTLNSLRETHANLSCDTDMPAAQEATVAARIAFGYPRERPIRTDCFDEDVRRQCRRVINDIYRCLETSSGPVVYVISAGDAKFVKIGFSTNFEQRLRPLRTASHVEPTVHLVMPGTRSLERDLHERFASARHNREWFRLTAEVETFITSQRALSGTERSANLNLSLPRTSPNPE